MHWGAKNSPPWRPSVTPKLRETKHEKRFVIRETVTKSVFSINLIITKPLHANAGHNWNKLARDDMEIK